MRRINRSLVALVVLVGAPWAASGQCGSEWSDQYGAPSVPGASCMVVHDDGSGPAIYMGINTTYGSYAQYGVVRWHPGDRRIESVGGHSSLLPSIKALAVFDDGSGPALYATGGFDSTGSIPCNHIANGNGSVWLPLGSGLDGTGRALAVYDDGSGPALYVGGDFTTAGGLSAPRLARWNGTTWSPVANITSTWPSPFISALAVFNPGTGPRLYAGGTFTNINGANISFIASYDGATWSSLGPGIVPNGSVNPIDKLAVHDDGSGAKLYAAGQFNYAGGQFVSFIARWDGIQWSPVGQGITGGQFRNLLSWSSPTGPKLVVGGVYAVPHIDFWNGTSWTTVDGHGTDAACIFDAGNGSHVYAVGDLVQGTSHVDDIFYEYDGTSWSLPAAQGFVSYEDVRTLVVHDDGTGPQLYAGGTFMFAGGGVAEHLARWNGTRWSPVGAGMQSGAVVVGSVASGPFAGMYASAGGLTRKWDGANLSVLGSPNQSLLSSMLSYDPGAGPILIGGGAFNLSGIPSPFSGVAWWTGTTWNPIGAAFAGPYGGTVRALKLFDDGSGSALYAGGDFVVAGGAPATGIAKWNGVAWSPVGSGVAGEVTCLEVFDDGTGPALYAGGSFSSAGGVSAANVAKWNGTSWSALSSGTSGANGKVQSLLWFNDGTGTKLYAGGFFTTAGGVDAPHLACWNGNAWSSLGNGVDYLPFNAWNTTTAAWALAAYAPAGDDPSLFVGGHFNTADGNTSSNFAELVPTRPRLSVTELGGAAGGVVLVNSNLTAGAEYFNLFSGEPAPGGAGTGPYLGLYATNLASLLTQLSLPLEAPPFHFTASGAGLSFGPYPVPAGIVIEGVCFTMNAGQIGCTSTNPRLTVP